MSAAKVISGTVLVTGGSGLVGRAFYDILSKPSVYADNLSLLKCENVNNWVFASSKDVDLSNLEECRAYFDRIKPTYVIHLAAMVGGLFKNMANNLQFLTKNMHINDNVLFCCHLYRVNKVVSCLSTCIFPDATPYPIDESMIHNGPPHPSNYGYSYAKRLIDVLNRGYNESGSPCVFTSVIPTNVYGPHDNFNLQDGHVVPCLMHKAYTAKEKNECLTVLGSGKPLRQFIYSYDLAYLILWTLRNYEMTEPIILSVDESEEISIGEVAEIIGRCMQLRQDQIEYDSSAADGQFKKTASNAKLRKYLPTFQFTNFEMAIQTTCDWFKQNFTNARK